MLEARLSFKTLRALPQGGSQYKLKVPIPSKGEFWFTFEESVSMEKVTKKISEEAPGSFVETDFSSRSLKEAMDANFYQLSINNTYFHIESKADLARQKNAFALYVDSLVKCGPQSKEEMDRYATHLLNVVGKEHQIIQKRLTEQLEETEREIESLNAKKYKILEADLCKNALKQYTKLGYLCFQWGVFYYTIFHIPWLGWDIMEPMTYSIGQGTFIYRLFKQLKCIRDCSSRTDMEQNLIAQNFDLGFYKKIIEERDTLKLKLKLINKTMNY